ncbi:MAG: YolD-like family protein [Erysipelotrichaceae bacterium]
MKWQPFAAVFDQESALQEMEQAKQYQNKPHLAQDQVEANERAIVEAIQSGASLCIQYYKNGAYYMAKGALRKIDQYHRLLQIGTITIDFTQIVCVEVL